ncbi:uncharacterized protein METZ01_LOCUS439818, partial [marine metagenome]
MMHNKMHIFPSCGKFNFSTAVLPVTLNDATGSSMKARTFLKVGFLTFVS